MNPAPFIDPHEPLDWLGPLSEDPLQLVTSDGAWRRGALVADGGALAAALLAWGAAPGTILLAPLPAPDLARLFFACARARIALFPLDPATSPERRAALLALAGPRGRLLEALPSAAAIAATAADPLPPLPVAAQPALVIATSGSEGEPKGVVLTHANLAAAADASAERLPLGPGDTWLACLPLHHIGGVSILARCARSSATARVLDRFTVEAVAAALAEGNITHLSLVPAMLDRLLEAGVPPGPLRYVLVGGAALSAPLFRRAMAAGWPLCVSYGLSECAAQVVTWVHPPPDVWQEGRVGAPLAGCRVELGPQGRLRLAGPQVMWGYLNPELEPGRGLTDGALLSGDLARLEADGSLTLLGRADDMLVSGGVNVHPAEVEAVLLACPGVRDAAVTALPDPVWGDRLLALVVGDSAAMDDAGLHRWCAERLPSPRRPRLIQRVATLPRNPMGKLQRPALRQLAQQLAQDGLLAPGEAP